MNRRCTREHCHWIGQAGSAVEVLWMSVTGWGSWLTSSQVKPSIRWSDWKCRDNLEAEFNQSISSNKINLYRWLSKWSQCHWMDVNQSMNKRMPLNKGSDCDCGIFLHLPLPSLAELTEFPELDFVDQFLWVLNAEPDLIRITITITDSIHISISINII